MTMLTTTLCAAATAAGLALPAAVLHQHHGFGQAHGQHEAQKPEAKPEAKEEPAAAGVAGVWALALLSHQMGLELEQEGTVLTGRLRIGGRYVPVDGEFKDGRLTLKAEMELRSRQGHKPVPLELQGRLKDDGTLEGDVFTPDGLEKWTGERLGKR